MVAVAWISLPTPTRAQIASELDDGKVVYVNGGSPKIHRGSTISSPSSSSRLSSLGKTGGLATGSLSTASEGSDPRLDRIVDQAAERHQLDPALVKAVISTESGWNPYAVSRKGAMGLMQLIPATAERYGVGNPYDPAQNIEGGATYLRWLLDRYNGDLTKSLAAYNAGERAVDESGGVPWYPETRRYVQKVTNAYFQSDSGHDPTLLSPPKAPVRKEVQSDGRVVFTNE
jgi:soluble lytic murein transglycosylase-like protein